MTVDGVGLKRGFQFYEFYVEFSNQIGAFILEYLFDINNATQYARVTNCETVCVWIWLSNS